MANVRNTPVSPIDRLFALQRELERTFNGGESADTGLFVPPMDVVESEHELQARLEIPGVSEDQIDIRVEDNMLTVAGEKQMEQVDERAGYRLVERRYGRFARSFTLPRGVDAGNVSATYDNGVLTVHLPKTEASKPRRVQVTRGRGQNTADNSGEGRNLDARNETTTRDRELAGAGAR